MAPDDSSWRFLDYGMAAFGAVLSLLWKTNSDKIKELQDGHARVSGEIREIELLVAGDYVKREDFERTLTALFAKLDRMETKIDGKANI